MNRKYVLALTVGIVLLVGLPFFGLSKTAPVKSAWADSPPAVDGSSQEWGEAAMTTYKKAKVNFAFKNDGDSLYVLFVFQDPKHLSSLNSTGLTVWLNPEGKESKNFGIRFIKKKVTADFYIAYLEKNGKALSEEDKVKIKAAPAYYFNQAVTVGKKGEVIPPSPDAGAEAEAVFRSKAQDKQTVYEISIPLAKTSEGGQGVGAEIGKTVKIGFEWGGLAEEMKDSGRRTAEGNLAGADSAARVADPSGMGSARLPRTPSSPAKYSFWTDVELAGKK